MVTQLEGGTFGGTAVGNVGIEMADLDAVQGAVLLVGTVISAAGNAALDAGIGVLVIHFFFLLFWSAVIMGEKQKIYSLRRVEIKSFAYDEEEVIKIGSEKRTNHGRRVAGSCEGARGADQTISFGYEKAAGRCGKDSDTGTADGFFKFLHSRSSNQRYGQRIEENIKTDAAEFLRHLLVYMEKFIGFSAAVQQYAGR